MTSKWCPTHATACYVSVAEGQRLSNDFIESILLDRKPIVDVSEALSMTMAGVIAHKSALRGGEWMTVPQYEVI